MICTVRLYLNMRFLSRSTVATTAVDEVMADMILLDILEEHLEEADFLWQQRKNALSNRICHLDSLAELEEQPQRKPDLKKGGKP